MDEGQIRLNKFLAERVGLSRRAADNAIADGKVTVNGASAILGARIDKDDEVCYNNKIISHEAVYTYLALNKPEGYVCSRKQQGDTPTIYSLLPEKYQSLKTVGRLDGNSSGIIILTNDGDFSYHMTHPSFVKEKRYEVTLDRDLEPLHQQMINDYGVMLEDGPSKLGLQRLSDENRSEWLVTMSEGRNRQIRRTFKSLGYQVVKLHRIQFGPYMLSGLKPGEFIETKKY